MLRRREDEIASSLVAKQSKQQQRRRRYRAVFVCRSPWGCSSNHESLRDVSASRSPRALLGTVGSGGQLRLFGLVQDLATDPSTSKVSGCAAFLVGAVSVFKGYCLPAPTIWISQAETTSHRRSEEQQRSMPFGLLRLSTVRPRNRVLDGRLMKMRREPDY